jgi:hypothetical protein
VRVHGEADGSEGAGVAETDAVTGVRTSVGSAMGYGRCGARFVAFQCELRVVSRGC